MVFPLFYILAPVCLKRFRDRSQTEWRTESIFVSGLSMWQNLVLFMFQFWFLLLVGQRVWVALMSCILRLVPFVDNNRNMGPLRVTHFFNYICTPVTKRTSYIVPPGWKISFELILHSARCQLPLQRSDRSALWSARSPTCQFSIYINLSVIMRFPLIPW